MSAYYTCDLEIGSSLHEQMLLTLIKKGEKIGLQYLDLQSFADELYTASSMSSEKTVEYIMAGKTTQKNNIDFPKSLTVLFQETYFTLGFYEKDKAAHVYFFALENPWYKNFNNELYFDFGRYVKLLIDLCEDFPIVKIETSID